MDHLLEIINIHKKGEECGNVSKNASATDHQGANFLIGFYSPCDF